MWFFLFPFFFFVAYRRFSCDTRTRRDLRLGELIIRRGIDITHGPGGLRETLSTHASEGVKKEFVSLREIPPQLHLTNPSSRVLYIIYSLFALSCSKCSFSFFLSFLFFFFVIMALMRYDKSSGRMGRLSSWLEILERYVGAWYTDEKNSSINEQSRWHTFAALMHRARHTCLA